jgi:hypothetical protein
LDKTVVAGMLETMPLFARDSRKHVDSLVDPPRDASMTSGSNSDAEDSAAHIAELVRRTAERLAAPSPSAVARTTVTPTRRPSAPAASDKPPGFSQPPAAQSPLPVAPSPAPARRQPSRRALVAGAAVIATLAAGALVLSNPFGLGAGRAPAAQQNAAPAGYAVKVTDVITDCASHSHGRTKSSFEAQNCVKATRSLATGKVNGHSTLFVTSRIQMTTVEAAASVKQVLDSTGTGNLNDLLREGRAFPGAPRAMPDSGYASVQSGTVVLVAEAGFLDAPSSSTNPALRAAAAQVATLVTATS